MSKGYEPKFKNVDVLENGFGRPLDSSKMPTIQYTELLADEMSWHFVKIDLNDMISILK